MLIGRWCSKYLGISDSELGFSMMVRKNMLDRDAALRRLGTESAEEDRLVGQYVEDIVEALGPFKERDRVVDIWQARLAGGASE